MSLLLRRVATVLSLLSADGRMCFRVRKKTCLASQNLLHLCRVMNSLNREHILGDIVECGVWKGGSAALLATKLQGNTLHIYDSFIGMPDSTAKDGTLAQSMIGQGGVDEEEVCSFVRGHVPNGAHLQVHSGWFHETFIPEQAPDSVRLLHVDCDWYESVLQTLDFFYDKVTPGGYIILDDYAYWQGARQAYYDFCAKRGIAPILHRIENGHAYWFKGEE